LHFYRHQKTQLFDVIGIRRIPWPPGQFHLSPNVSQYVSRPSMTGEVAVDLRCNLQWRGRGENRSTAV